ncbi:hypothetical protein XcvCFBP7113P_17365 [Xanthomonas citri pv. vignicola]|nr:hypothetical protein XcvCFBP7113P_17365 [Xanthomonas citri pv. vignicola]
MALQKGQRLREVGQFEVAEVGQIKSAGDTSTCTAHCYPRAHKARWVLDWAKRLRAGPWG